MIVIGRDGPITQLFAGFRQYPKNETEETARYRYINLRLISPIENALVQSLTSRQVFNQTPKTIVTSHDCIRFRHGTFVLKFSPKFFLEFFHEILICIIDLGIS